MILHGITQGQIPRLTRKYLQQREDKDEWKKLKYKQLDSYDRLSMFGEPFKRPQSSNVLLLIWTRVHKLNGTKRQDMYVMAVQI